MVILRIRRENHLWSSNSSTFFRVDSNEDLTVDRRHWRGQILQLLRLFQRWRVLRKVTLDGPAAVLGKKLFHLPPKQSARLRVNDQLVRHCDPPDTVTQVVLLIHPCWPHQLAQMRLQLASWVRPQMGQHNTRRRVAHIWYGGMPEVQPEHPPGSLLPSRTEGCAAAVIWHAWAVVTCSERVIIVRSTGPR